MNINWIVRLKSKEFWAALIPAVVLLVTQVAAMFGYTLDLSALQEQMVAVAGTVFTLLAILGIVNDPTTEGFGDSLRALRRDRPLTLDEELAGKEG